MFQSIESNYILIVVVSWGAHITSTDTVRDVSTRILADKVLPHVLMLSQIRAQCWMIAALGRTALSCLPECEEVLRERDWSIHEASSLVADPLATGSISPMSNTLCTQYDGSLAWEL